MDMLDLAAVSLLYITIEGIRSCHSFSRDGTTHLHRMISGWLDGEWRANKGFLPIAGLAAVRFSDDLSWERKYMP